ncbi:MAG: type 4a pilus biogenesis protein PilO [Elusimicrobiota bacterium]
MKRTKDILRKQQEVFFKYKDFEKLVKYFEQHKEEALKLLQEYLQEKTVSKDERQLFLEKVGRISSKAGAAIQSMKPIKHGSDPKDKEKEPYENIYFKINISAGYKDIGEFVTYLEQDKKIFGIEKFDIKSGKDSPEHKINLTVYNVLFPEYKGVENNLSTDSDIFELHSKVKKATDEIKKEKDKILEKFDIKKDPMYYKDTIFIPQRRRIPPPKIQLEGIIWDKDNPMAVVNGEVKEKGDYVKGAKIVKINKNSITILWRSRWYKYNLKK